MRPRTPALWLLLAGLSGLAIQPIEAEEDAPETRLYDTVAPLTAPLSQEALAKRFGWRQIPENSLDNRFTRNAVALNDKLGVLFQTQHHGPEIYSRSTGRLLATAGFAPAGSSAGQLLEGFRILENTAAGVKIEAAFKGGAVLRFRITTGESIFEIQSPQGTGTVSVQSATRYVVVPDYFGDDMVYGSRAFAGLLPAENFCLNLLGDGEAILMTVWQSNTQDATLASARDPQSGGSWVHRVSCQKDKSIWLAFLEGPGIWSAQTGLSANRWKGPFPAKWRSSFVRERNEADSWDAERGPAPEQSAGKHEGPLLNYLIDRTTATPLTATCPTDVMRNTFGVGPCQYILACEGLGSQGDPTPNSVMGWIEKQFQQKKQRKAAEDIKERLGHMTKHVEDARAKVRKYEEFALRIQTMLEGKTGVESLRSTAAELSRFAAAGLTAESAPERARQLAGEVVSLLGKDNAPAECQVLGEQLRSIGAIQDRALARCRMSVRRLRQEARIIAGEQLAAAASIHEVQLLAEQILQNK